MLRRGRSLRLSVGRDLAYRELHLNQSSSVPTLIGRTSEGIVSLNLPTVPLSVEEMTSSQLVRRARLLEATNELVNEIGAHSLQMKDIALRSNVALGTVYRYFASKEHLLATAFAEWKDRSVRRLAANGSASNSTPVENVSSYLQRELHTLHRNPQMALLVSQMVSSNDPYVKKALERMSRTESRIFRELMPNLDPDLEQSVHVTLGALLAYAVNRMATRTADYKQAADDLARGARLVLEGALSHQEQATR